MVRSADIDVHSVQEIRHLCSHDVRNYAIMVDNHKELDRTWLTSGGSLDARFYDRDVIRVTHDDLHYSDIISASMVGRLFPLIGQLQRFS